MYTAYIDIQYSFCWCHILDHFPKANFLKVYLLSGITICQESYIFSLLRYHFYLKKNCICFYYSSTSCTNGLPTLMFLRFKKSNLNWGINLNLDTYKWNWKWLWYSWCMISLNLVSKEEKLGCVWKKHLTQKDRNILSCREEVRRMWRTPKTARRLEL